MFGIQNEIKTENHLFQKKNPMKSLKVNPTSLLILLVFLSSCATIINGRKENIRLNSNPQGANVLVNGRDLGLVTPCLATLNRKVKQSAYNNKNEYRFVFTKDGYSNYEVIDYRTINPNVYWNVFTWIFMIGTVPTDFITGAAYKHNNDIFASLQLKNETLQLAASNNIEEDKQPPNIVVISPDMDRGFKQIMNNAILVVSGRAEDESGILEVIINGMQATVIEDGTFEANIPLQMGRNKISITAKDNKMNIALESFYIERSNEYLDNNSAADNTENTGKYHALIIGVQDYNDDAFRDLDNPILDAKKLFKTLTKLYNFDSTNILLLENPKTNEITQALENYFNNLNPSDNLLIFYAGHGYWDSKFKQGYWLAADASENNRGSWLSNSTIRDYMRAISAKHSLLISDACFAGGIFNSRDAFPDASKAINQMYNLPSRKAMTSGAMNQVPDISVFIDYLIKRLENNNENYLSAEQLFASFKMAVINNSTLGQVPQYGEVKETGDEGGDFIFVRKKPEH